MCKTHPTPLIISFHHMCASDQMCACCLEDLLPVHTVSQCCKQSATMFLCGHSTSLHREKGRQRMGSLHILLEITALQHAGRPCSVLCYM